MCIRDRNSPTWKNVSRSGQPLPEKSPAASGSGPALPENSPAGQNVSRSGQALPENSQVGKIERMRPSFGKNVSGSGQPLPENSPAASGSGKRWAKVTRKQSDGAKC